MTSALRGEGVRKYPNFADKQYIKFGQRGEGVKKSRNFADILYGSPQSIEIVDADAVSQ